MSLKVVVHSASLNLPDVRDPFVVLSFRGIDQKTPLQKDTLNPEKNTFTWPLRTANILLTDKLSIKVKDNEKVWFKKLLGQTEIPIREVRENRKIEKRAYDLEDDNNHTFMDATITLEIEYIPSGDEADGMIKKREERKESPGDEEEDDYDEEDEQEGEDDGGRKGAGKRKVVEKKRTRRRLTRKRSNKTKDFQIRIHIIEGRHLPGSDIHPLVRVTVAGQRQHTDVAQSTNRPIYNKMLAFDFHTSETELFDEPILVEVFNSRGIFRHNSLLGFYKFDVGYVYERKGHSFICKWIMLCKPDGKKDDRDDESLPDKHKTRGARSPAGYLKVSAVVQGPGDKLPVGIDARSTDDKDEDIDANCLIPVGVHRQPTMFVLKVYQANDLPQMDAGVVIKFKTFFAKLAFWSESSEKEDDRYTADLMEGKNLVDPYLTFSFSGKEVSTDIKYNSSNPKFCQILKIPSKLPSMCERLKLQLMDWDQGIKDDYIGTAFISLSSISALGGVGEGFLPQFGPCFINFYGSPREYHQMPDKYEYLNRGVGEGVAYRGRVLVKLTTEPTHRGVARPDKSILSKEDVIRCEPYRGRSNFTLFACFHEATMVAVTDKPVEFELSIGNKGSKFDESVANSNTTPCKAVPDGFHYHYLPWGREKPCVWIECKWEDIAFRIEPLNILSRVKEKLEEDLKYVTGLKDDPDGLQKMQSVVEDFKQTCGKIVKHFTDVIPKMSGHRNPLDNEIYILRQTELKNLMVDAQALHDKPERNKESVIVEMKNYIRRIRSMAIEPQLSIPDVILWMISGNKRIAYYRIPAHDLMYSEVHEEHMDACGKFCGKVIELPLKYPGREGETHLEIPALVRLELWLGQAKHQQRWMKRENGDFNVYAERYENEVKSRRGNWEPSKSPNWPDSSDVAGNLKLPKDSFVEPDGWEFSGSWIKPKGELRTTRHPDENLTEFFDKVYEHETRKFPGGDWEPAKPRYEDLNGYKTTLPAEPPRGWSLVPALADEHESQKSTTGWTVDLNRAVDEEGWEYAVHRSYGDYGPEEKAFHLSRRRRRIRLRRRVPSEEVQKVPPPSDGWEYARTLHEGFHLDKKSTDYLRRRRWLHKIKTLPDERTKEGGKKFPIFKVMVQGTKKGKESALCVLPRMFVTYQSAIKYELWVSIYQARGLMAQDDTGMNDPYVRVTFTNKSTKTKTLSQTLSPTWDETLIFQEVNIFGSPEDLKKNPPSVVMELFDEDKREHVLLGRCMLKPKVLLKGDESPEPKLAWHKIRKGEQDGGQILVECELFLADGACLPARPKKQGDVFPIRDGLRPATQKKAIEVKIKKLKCNKSVPIHFHQLLCTKAAVYYVTTFILLKWTKFRDSIVPIKQFSTS